MPQYFDPSQSMNALAQGMNVGSHIRDKQTQNALSPMVAKGDFKGAMDYAGSRGDLGQVQDMKTQYEAQLATMSEQDKQAAAKRAETLARTAAGLQGVPYEQRKAMLMQNMPMLQEMGMDPAMIQNFDPTDEGIGQVLAQVTPLTELLKKPSFTAPVPVTGPDGKQAYAQFNDQGTAPNMFEGVSPYQKPDTPDYDTWEDGNRRMTGILGQPDTYQEIGEVYRKPEGDGGQPPLDFGEVYRMRETNEKRFQAFETAQRNYLSMAELAKDGTGAADVALGFAFFKTIDPTSTVREGEFAQAATAMGLGGQVVSIFKRLDNGEKFTPALRAELVAAAGRAYEQQTVDIQALAERENEFARRMNVDPALVSRNPVRTSLPNPAAMTGPPPQEAVQELMADMSPEAVAEFNEIFGEGAAEKSLQSIMRGAR